LGLNFPPGYIEKFREEYLRDKEKSESTKCEETISEEHK